MNTPPIPPMPGMPPMPPSIKEFDALREAAVKDLGAVEYAPADDHTAKQIEGTPLDCVMGGAAGLARILAQANYRYRVGDDTGMSDYQYDMLEKAFEYMALVVPDVFRKHQLARCSRL